VPTAASQPYRLTSGPDGNVWFTELGAGRIGRMDPADPAATVTDFSVPTARSQPQAITAGPDGNLWFTEYVGNRIARITRAGAVTEYSAGLSVNSGPEGIAAGPDGKLWFTEYAGNRLGQLTPSTGAISQMPLLPNGGSQPDNIVAGPDGNMWFTEYGGDRIGRTSTSGVRAEFSVPTPASAPDGITVGPDKALWFTEYNGNRIGRISTSGTVTEFPVPTPASHPETIVAGPDGALWFTESAGNKIGRITTTGVFTEFPVPAASAVPDGIAVGADRNLWYSEFSANQVARVTPGAANAVVLPTGPVPVTRTLSQGTTLVWSFFAAGSHAVSDKSGMGLFGSGNHTLVSYYPFRFIAAGNYPYTDTATAKAATIAVPPIAAPSTGTTGTTFKVTWAIATAPTGYTYDVQIKRPASGYANWQAGVSASHATFVPDAGSGTYAFRARLRHTADNTASGYSPAKLITAV
jgi:streptogramin lyase